MSLVYDLAEQYQSEDVAEITELPRFDTLTFEDGQMGNPLDYEDMYLFNGPTQQSSAPSRVYDFDVRTWVICEMRDRYMEYNAKSRTLERAL